VEVIKPYGYDEIASNKDRLEIVDKLKVLNEKATEYSKLRTQIFRYIYDAMRLCFPTKNQKIKLEDSRGYRDKYLVLSKEHIGTQWYKGCHIDDLRLEDEKDRKYLIPNYSKILECVKKDKVVTFKRIWKFFLYCSSQHLPTEETFESEPFYYQYFNDISGRLKSIGVEIRSSFVYIIFGNYPQKDKSHYWRDKVDLSSYHNAVDYYELFPTIKSLLIKADRWLDKMLKRVQRIWASDDCKWIREFVEIYSSLRDL